MTKSRQTKARPPHDRQGVARPPFLPLRIGTGGAGGGNGGQESTKRNGSEAVPTLALRSGLCGEFVDFGLLPALVLELDHASGRPAISRWADLLDEWGFDSRHIDPDDGRTASAVAAEGA